MKLAQFENVKYFSPKKIKCFYRYCAESSNDDNKINLEIIALYIISDPTVKLHTNISGILEIFQPFETEVKSSKVEKKQKKERT